MPVFTPTPPDELGLSIEEENGLPTSPQSLDELDALIREARRRARRRRLIYAAVAGLMAAIASGLVVLFGGWGGGATQHAQGGGGQPSASAQRAQRVERAAVTATTPMVPAAIGFFDTRHGVLAKIEGCSASFCPGALFVSDDSGRSWKRTLTVRGRMDMPESPVDIDAVRGSSLVWATTARALLRSDDRGRSWQRALSVHALAVSFSDPEHGWLLPMRGAFARPPAILSSDDGGRTWRRLASPCQGYFPNTVAISRASASLGWVACIDQDTSGYEGKRVWQTSDGGHTWRLRSRTELFVPRPAPPIGNLPGRGYVSGMQFLPDGHGWLWEDRGWLLTTSDGGRRWRKSPLTSADEVEARSASLLSDRTGFILLGVDPACHNRLVLSTDGARRATMLKSWPSTFDMCS